METSENKLPFDILYLFMCLLANLNFVLVKCLNPWPMLGGGGAIGLFIAVVCFSVFWKCSLSDMCLVNIFSQWVVYLFIFLRVFFEEKILIWMSMQSVAELDLTFLLI